MRNRETIAPTQVGLEPQLRVLDGIAQWCGGLHGAMPLGDALEALAYGFDAECAVLTRHHRSDVEPRPVAICDRRLGEDDLPTLTRAYASDVLGYFYDKARASTIWFLTDQAEDRDWVKPTALSRWQTSREIAEMVVMVLASSAQHVDYIEFHFERVLPRSEKLEFEALLPTILRSWIGRQTGLVTQAHLDARFTRARASFPSQNRQKLEPILGDANPAKLSRAEFRVCLLLSRGLSIKGVTDELGLTEATVRTHLRSIYAKTGASGLAELLYRILSNTAEATVEEDRRVQRRA